jgi:hypothetical protein
MALIALRNIRCIDYLAYGAIFTRVMFLPKKKGDVFLDFFSRQKSPRCLPGGGEDQTKSPSYTHACCRCIMPCEGRKPCNNGLLLPARKLSL